MKATAEEKQETTRKMVEYLTRIIEREREQPGNTVIGLLVKAWGQGEAFNSRFFGKEAMLNLSPSQKKGS